jgi:ATP-dependent DNA helicase PIF1
MPTLDELLNTNPQPSSLEENNYVPSSVHCKFITGAAGTGKTYLQKKLIEEDPKYGLLTATTGIAAINLGTTTLNSVLGYYDTDKLRDNFDRGYLTSKLHKIGKSVRNLVIDEISMMDGRQLDYIHNAANQANQFKDMEGRPLGIICTGDFCQLPPVKAPWAFEADSWSHFEHDTVRLEKIWRQDNLEFLQALNHARKGEGQASVDILKSLGVKFKPSVMKAFQGSTIMSKNDQVDNHNYSELIALPGVAYGMKSLTWGDQAGEWKNIPEMLKLKDGAYVMILANASPADGNGFAYANGDCGTIQSKDMDGTIWVKLARNESLVGIRPIIRYKVSRGDEAEKLGLDPWDENVSYTHIYCDCGEHEAGIRHGEWGKHSYNCSSGTWNIGAIKFYPLRLAYATTAHKSQGLTLDRVQIDIRDPFFGHPGMAYVALSRCKSHEGLTIVGEPSKLAERIKVDPKVRKYL